MSELVRPKSGIHLLYGRAQWWLWAQFVRCVGCVRYGGVLSLGAERRLGELSHGPVRR